MEEKKCLLDRREFLKITASAAVVLMLPTCAKKSNGEFKGGTDHPASELLQGPYPTSTFVDNTAEGFEEAMAGHRPAFFATRPIWVLVNPRSM